MKNNLNIDDRYSTYSISIILYLLHNNEDYNKLWISHFPQTENQASNFFKDENCGCRPVLLQTYKKLRFKADLFTVQFLIDNPSAINFDEFTKEIGGQDLRGSMFSVNKTESDFKDFMSIIQQKKAAFTYFNTVALDDKILITFF
jgi:hypothetical protein